MVCPRCNQPVENGATFCGNCGNQITPVLAAGATELVAPENNPYQITGEPTIATPPTQETLPPVGQSYNSISPLVQRETARPYPAGAGVTPLPRTMSTPPPVSAPPVSLPPVSKPARLPRKRIAFIAAIIALLIIGLSAGLITLLQTKSTPSKSKTAPAVAATSTMGSVYFSSSLDAQAPGITDTVTINISGLSAPAAGTQYYAWLVNQQQEQTTPLGKLTSQGKDFSVTYTDHHGQNLLGLGDTISVTQEQGNVTLPTGKAVLTAQFPQMAFIHIKHILYAFPITPHHVGLLVGLLRQAHQVEAQAVLLNGLSGNGNPTAVTCAAQSLINIVEGQHGQHYSQLPLQCNGLNATVGSDGFGLLGQNGYIRLAGEHASLAAQASDATQNIKSHAALAETSLTNVNNWMTTVDNDAQSLLTNPGDNGKIQEIVALTERAIDGVDLNNDGQVDPVPGEGGILTAYQQGQQMAQLSLQKA
jgi:hypothetical protein